MNKRLLEFVVVIVECGIFVFAEVVFVTAVFGFI